MKDDPAINGNMYFIMNSGKMIELNENLSLGKDELKKIRLMLEHSKTRNEQMRIRPVRKGLLRNQGFLFLGK